MKRCHFLLYQETGYLPKVIGREENLLKVDKVTASHSSGKYHKTLCVVAARLRKLTPGIKKGKITEEDKKRTLANVTPTDKYEDLADCDLIIEAALEVLEVKEDIFKKLDELCKESTIFASNTSSISITKLASAVSEEMCIRDRI